MIGVPVTEEVGARSTASRFTLAIAGQTVVLREGENLVGRSPDAAVLLDLPSISRRHALIQITGNQAMVEDLQSKNGTFVENERVHDARELPDRATIRFGSICGIFRSIPIGGSTATDPLVTRKIQT